MPKGNAIQLNDSSTSGDIFDLKINVFRDADNKIVSGLCVGPVTQQNTALLLIINPGECKEFPTAGVGLGDATLDDDLLEYRHAIRRNCALDDLKIKTLDLFDLTKINIETTY